MNFLSILVAAVAGMAVGFFWFGPIFGKVWVKLSGFTREDMEKAQAKGMGKTYALAFLTVLVTAWVLSIMISEFAGSTGEALRLGFLIWLGFLVPTMANSYLWEGKPSKLVLINLGERLVTLLIMSGILSAWR
jgi:hypothetical protein